MQIAQIAPSPSARGQPYLGKVSGDFPSPAPVAFIAPAPAAVLGRQKQQRRQEFPRKGSGDTSRRLEHVHFEVQTAGKAAAGSAQSDRKGGGGGFVLLSQFPGISHTEWEVEFQLPAAEGKDVSSFMALME